MKNTQPKTSRKRPSILATSAAALIAVCFMPASIKAGQVWDGDTDGNWATAANWDANTLPNFAVGLQFAGAVNVNTNNNGATATVAGITFNAGAGLFTLGGNAITLSNGITVNSANTQTISFTTTGVTLGNSQTWNTVSGSLNVTSNVAMGGNTLTIDGGNTTTIGGAITSGAGAILNKNGAGTLNINNASASVTGNVNVNAGNLNIGAAGNLTTGGTLNVSGASTLTAAGVASTITGNVNWTSSAVLDNYQGVIAGAGSAVTVNNSVASAGLFLSGTNTYGGLTQITAGFLNASNSSALGLNGAGAAAQGTVVLAGGTLGLGSAFGSGFAIGNEALTINGAGTTNFGGAIGALANVSGANTYAGAVTLGSNSSISVDLGTTLTLTGGIIKNGLNLTLFGRGGAGGILNINTTGISGAAANSDVIIDNGLLTNWNAANTYNGATFIRNGSTLSANVANALPTANGRTALSLDDIGAGSSILNLRVTDQSIRSLSSPVASSTVNLSADGIAHILTIGDTNPTTTTFAGQLTGLGGITKDTNGSTLIISNPLNNYTGPTRVTGGTLRLGNNNVIPDASAVTVTGVGAFLDLQAFSDTVASVLLQSGGQIIGAGTLTSLAPYALEQGVISANLGGAFAPNTPAINKTTVGTVTLTGNNTFTGVTNVLAGILEAGSNNALGAGGLGNGTVVSDGATLRLLGGVSLLTEPLNLTGTGVGGIGALAVQPGVSTIGGPVTLGGAVGSTTTIIAGAGTTINFTGGILKDARTLVFTGLGGGIFNVNTVGISGPTVFTSDFVVNGGVTNFNVANAYAGPTWIGNGGTLNANVLGALPSPAADGGIAAIRTLVIMDPDTLANFPGAPAVIVPPGSTAPSILNLNANQAIQSLASANTAGIGTNSFVNLNNSTLTIGTGAGTTTFFGVIGSAPAGGVTKDGLSTQILAGNNTYLGLTWVQAGHLQIGNGLTGNLNGASAVTVNPAAFLDLRLANNATFANNVLNNGTVAGINTAPNTQTVSGVITGIGNFLQNAGGRTIFTNINTYQGGTAITAASTLQVGNAALQGSVGTGAVSVSGGSFFTLINVNGNVLPNNVSNTVGGLGTVISTPAFAVNTTLSGSLTDALPGTLTLTQNGAGTTTLTNGGNNYSAGTTVSLGTLQIGNAGNASSAGINTAANGINVGTGGTLLIVNLTAGSNPMLNNITNTLGATGTVNVNSANNNTLAGSLIGAPNTLALTQSGTGTTTLTNAANNINGTTTVSAGNLTVGTAALASRLDAAGTSTVTVGTGGVLTLVNLVGNALANNITNTLGGAGLVTVNSVNTNTLSGILSNGIGTMALTQNNAAGTTILTGVNTYTGPTNVLAGVLQIAGAGNLNVGSAVTVNPAAFLDLNLAGGSTFANNVLDNGTVRGINAAGSQTVSGVISGVGSFAQTGAGTTIFTNVNTFTGGTAISNAGTVQVGTVALAGSLDGGLVSVSGGGFLNLVNLSGNAFVNNVSNVVGGVGTVNVNSVNTNTLSGTFTDGAPGTLAFAQNGTGTTILTGVNGYNGGTKVTGGVLQVGTAALASSLGNNILANTVAVGTGGTLSIVNLAGGANPLLNAITNNTGGVGTVNVNSVNTVTLGGPLTNTAGTLALAQTNILGTTILTNAGNTYAGGTTVSAGVLQVGTAALASSLGSNVAGNTVSVGNGATLSIVNLIAGANPLLNNITNNLAGTGLVNVNSANANTLGGILSNGAGTLALMQSGLGTTTLTGANTYTGATTVALGTLQIGNGAIGSISTSTPVTVNGPGTLDINVIGAGGGIFANTVLNNGVVRGINAAATTQTYSGVISGAGSFSQISGTGIFTNVNTYAGGTTINGPTTTLQIGTGVSAAAAGSGNININGGSTLSLVNVSGNLLSNNMTNTAGGLAGTVAVNSALTTTISGSIKDGAGGPLQLNHNGTGTTILTNTGNTYTGLTTINAGLLQIGTIAQAGSIGGGTPIKIGAGATLSIVNLGNPGTLSNTVIQNSLGGIGTLNVNSFLNNTITSQLTDGGLGTLALTQTGTGTTFLTGAAANTYTGGTTITAGTLSVGNGGAVGLTPLGTGIVTNNAALTFNATNALLVIGNNIGGTGNLSQIGAGTTALTGANTYTGTTLISAGALQVGNGGAAGTLGVGAVTDNASLIFNRSDAFSVANAIGGTGNVTQQGTGVTTLTGASNYTGTTTVVFGNLRVNGSLGNTAVTVNSGATLSGFGSIAGSVNILGGGNLNPGTSPGTVTFGSLVLNPLSNSNFELGVPGVIGQAVLPGNDLVNVTGNLTIDGILNVTQLAGFGPGSYRLFNYGGVLTNNIIDSIVGAPVGSTIVTGVANQVNLLVLNAGAGISQFWDGAGLPNDALIAGGNGNWDNFNNNFTNAAGTVNSAWQNGTAVFGSAAGTVTLINPINAQGLAFTVSGYVINGLGGNTLNLVGPAPAPTITVGAGLSATINAQITGANGLTADGAGTLFLNNVGNSYTGGTTINGGTVSVSNDGSLGAAAGGLTLNNGILQATSTFSSARTIALTGPGTIDVTALNTFTETGIVSGGAGFALNKTGTGTLNLTNVANSYLGGTVIQGGILQVTSNANLGNVAGGVTFVNNATLQTLGAIASARAVTLNAGGGTIDTNGFNSTLSGVIGGAAGNNLTKIGAGTLIATGTSTYLGATNVNAGTLQVGDGVLLNSQIGNNTANVVVNNGAALAVNLANAGTFGNTVTVNAGGAVNAIGANAANTQTLSGVISGAGVFNQNSAGATVITGVNTYTGVTNVNTGTLQIGNGLTGNLNALSQVNVAGGATLAANLGNLQTLGNNIANAGTINSINGAAVTQTISGNITGVGTFNQTNAGTTFLTGASTYTGATNVGGNGTLRVNGSLGNTAVTVQSGATLGGVGNIAGSVTVLAGGNLAAGNSAGTITIGTLVLNAGSNSNFELATPGIIGAGVNDLVNVTGNLTIDGNLNLTAVAPPFGSGSYRLFNYGGVLTNNVFDAITGVPVGFTTAVVLAPGQVNLLVLGNGIGPVQTWDGPGPVNNGVANGGSGNWDNFQNNWTGVGGANPNAAWQNGTAVFGAPNGTVTITDTVNAQGLIFGTNGYVINGLGGNTLNLVGQNPAVASVPFISVTNAGDNATINAQITNTAILPVFSNGLSSTGAGRLVLTNVANNYTGGTNISGTGTVSISSDTNLGASGAGNGVTFGATGGVLQITSTFTLGAGLGRNILLTGNGAIDVTDSNTVTYGSATSVISGAGALSKTGTGTLNLVGVNTYSGGTSILGGVLQVANDNALGNVAGGLTFANNATLQTLAAIVSARVVTLNAGGGTVDTNGFNSTLSGVIGGVGSLTKAGAGTLLLTGVETYTGATNVNGGTLQVGNGVSGNLAAASVVNVNNVSTFGVNLANGGTLANTIITSLGAIVTGNNGAASTQTLSGVISGAGALNQNGAGTTILTAANTYTGTTTALQGTLQIGNGATGSISVSSAVSTLAGATLALNLANGGIFANDVANAGAVNGLVAGANVNTISGIISGVGVLNQNGTGTTILTGANSYSGATTVNFGTLQIGNGLIGSINPASPVTVAGGATLAVNLVTGGTLGNNIVDNGSVNAIQTGINNIIGVISGTGVFNQNGTGTTNVSGANTYLGLTTVNAGILEVRNNTALGTVAAGTVVINGASLRLATGITVGAEALTINGFGAAGTTGALTNVAGGTATYGGAITAATNSSISSNGGNLTLTGGIVKTNVALILNNAGGVINVNGVGITGDLVGFNDDLVANGGTTNLNVANNYVGPTWLINGATVNANVINALPNSNNVNLALRTTVEFENQSGATPGVMAAGTGGSILSLGAAQSAQWIDGSFGAVPASRINLNGNILTLGTTALPNGSVAPPLGGAPDFRGVIADGTGAAGSGGVTKDGLNTQILSGLNTYTGATRVTGGTLRAGSTQAFGVNSPVLVGAAGILDLAGNSNTIGSLSDIAGVGGIVQNTGGAATLTTGALGANTAYAGLIQGPTALVLVGGAQALSNNLSSYTNGTTVNGGTLNINASSLPAPGVGPVTGPIGTGLLTINGGGIGTTSAGLTDNDVANAVQINNGFNVTGNAVNVIGGPVVSNGVTFSGPVNLGTTPVINTTSGFLDLTGVVSGGGNGITFTGNTFTLIGRGGMGDAPNTFTGLTDVQGGLVLLGKGSAIAGADGVALAGNVKIDAGAVLQVNSNFLSGGGTANNQIARTASAIVNGILDIGGTNQTLNNLNGSGIVRLDDSAVNAAFAGAPGTRAGVLTVSSGFLTGSIVDGGLNGQLVKNTGGTLYLTGVNTYLGNTTINGGRLIVDGSIASRNTYVNAGGLLGGRGIIGGNVFNSGVVSPGSSVATLTIKGNYTQSSAGTLVIEVAGKSAGQHDLLAVGGTANLDGTVRILNTGAVKLKRGDKITFLTAGGGVNGTFANESNGFKTGNPLLEAHVIYGSNIVSLQLLQGSFAALNGIIGLTPNQIATARALDQIAGSPKLGKVLDHLDALPLNRIPQALDDIAPEEFASITSLGVSLANVQTANLQRRMSDIRSGGQQGFHSSVDVNGYPADGGGNYGPSGKGGKELVAPADRVGVFITGAGEFSNIAGTFNARGYDLTTGGFTLGVDYRLTDNLVVGLMTGYANTGIDLFRGGRISVDGGKVGIYATYFSGGFYVDTAVSGGYNTYETQRRGLLGTARGSTDGGEFNGLIATGYDVKRGGLTFGPVASFQYTYVGIGKFAENGSLTPLQIGGQHNESTRTALGVKASYDMQVGGVVVRPEVRAAWQHEFADVAYAVDSRFSTGGGGTFTVNGPELGRDSLLLGAGFAVLWNERTSTYVYYDGELGRTNYNSQNVSGGVRMSF